MRFLIKASIPVEAGNKMVSNPNFGKLIDNLMAT